ncbi:endonuclease NucS (plasmid) [Halorutilales archaeon Cl-col2-1]
MSNNLESIPDPSHREALELVTEALEKRRTINIIGRCEVDYDGRASSYLGVGDRVILIKPDGTLLVHQDEKRKPVNWQPPGSTAQASLYGDKLKIKSRRTSPRETISIVFEDVYQVTSMKLEDSREISLEGAEEQMQNRIMMNPDIIEEGFRAIEKERESDYGRIDVFGRDSESNPVILELKRRRVGPKAVDQLQRYVENYRERGYEGVRGILVAPSVTGSAMNQLEKYDLEHVELEPETGVGETTKSLDEF